MKKNIYRVGIYLRLSEEDTRKANYLLDSESIKNQRYLLLNEIKKNNNFLLVDEYVDENYSGAGTYRPEFERLINDCEKGKLDIVLCKSQSRFSRDMEIVEKYIHNKFIEWNVRFISLSDNADTSNTGNKKARQINGLVNEWYLEDVSNNIRSAFKAKMLNGEYISPFAPFGYEIDSNNNNKLIVDNYAANVVKTIFELYLSGFGYQKIVNYLNEKNIPSPSYYKYQKGVKLNVVSNKERSKIKWNTSAIKTILTNEIYIGNLIQGKRTTISYKNHKIINKNKNEWIKISNTHAPIIDNNTFYQVQNLIKQRTRVSKSTNTFHLFTGKVFCMECGSIMKKKKSSKHVYLVCSNSQINLCCNKKSIRYDKLESIVLDSLNKLISKYYNSNYLVDKFNKFNINDKIVCLENEKIKYIKKKNEIDFYIKNLYEDKVNNIIDIIYFNKLMTNYINEQSYYELLLKSINDKILKFKIKTNNIITDVICNYNNFEKLNIVIIDEFIDKIVIGDFFNGKRIFKIMWNIKH